MAAKAKQRAAAEEQEAIDSGMMQLHGKGKRRRAQAKPRADRGLNEARGFTPGLMKAPKLKRGGASGSVGKAGAGRGRGGGGGGRRRRA